MPSHRYELNRRRALHALAAFAAGSPLRAFQQDPFRDHSRVPALGELRTALDFEAVAFARLPRAVFDYTAYGADSEFTLRRNRQAFDWVEITPRAQPERAPDTATQLLGTKLAFPILVSPTAGHLQLHPDGEPATYQGATAAAGTPMIVSNVSSMPFEKIAGTAKGPIWFQLYPRNDSESNRETLERVQGAGAQAVVVTIDQQTSYFERILHDRHLNPGAPGGVRRRTSSREAAPRNPYRVPADRLFYEWKLFDEWRKIVKVPLIAKGVLTPEDAKICLEHGIDAVYVSNHGARSLDYAPSSLEVLPEIVDAVGGRVPVMFDSGIRRGADILKALALGASAVCLGRIPRWGLAAYGAEGVQRALEIMQAEFKLAMMAAGCASLKAVNRSLVRTDFP